MRKIKQFCVDLGLYSKFNIDVFVIGQSKDGSRVIVRPVAGSGSFEIHSNQLKETYRNS